MPGRSKNKADATFRAFSDETRLRILYLLQQGDLCVNDLVQTINVPQPTASRHLAYLRRVELVTTRKIGSWTYYALAPAKTIFHCKLLECLESCFEEVPAFQKDLKRYASLKKSGGCCPK